jgi:hypothetical protein
MSRIRSFVKQTGYRIARASEWGLPDDRLDLTGDRDVEWAWVAAKFPLDAGHVLDFGPATSNSPLMAAFNAKSVTAFDLDPPPVSFSSPNLRYVKGDILQGELPEGPFDTIVNCSTIEHVGLSGRYGNLEETDGDLRAMDLLRERLAGPKARMIFTIPVGRDGVYRPYHRVYGPERLPRILAGHSVCEALFYAKTGSVNIWQQVSKAEALSVQGSENFYALGLFVLAAG